MGGYDVYYTLTNQKKISCATVAVICLLLLNFHSLLSSYILPYLALKERERERERERESRFAKELLRYHEYPSICNSLKNKMTSIH